MQLCDYGCGNKGIQQFKNGKWCCSKFVCQCSIVREKNKIKNIGRIVSNKTKDKLREANTGLKKSEQIKNKISESKKGQIPWNKGKTTGQIPWNKGKKGCFSEDAILKMKNSGKKENLTKYTLNKMKISSLLTIKQIQKKYPTFAKIEEMRYEPSKVKVIQVHCKNHLCFNSKEQGGWFTPTRSQIFERRRQIEDENGNGGGYFYCCDECKNTCPLFNLQSDPFQIEGQLYSPGEYQTFRQNVLKRENYLCEYCGEPATVVHHSRPQKLEPGFVLDPDFGIACCEKHHYQYGHKDDCSTGHLSQINCNK